MTLLRGPACGPARVSSRRRPRGDLVIYDEIVEALRQGHDADPLIAAFWAGAESPSPRMEMTVAKVKVRRKLAAALKRTGGG